MFKAYKVEIKPTLEQAEKIRQTIGVCRVVYNLFLQHSKERYDKGEKFIGAKTYSVWFNNEFIPNHPEFSWVKSVSSKAVKQAMTNAEVAFKRFFKKQGGYPKFKKKRNQDCKVYSPKNNPNDFKIERHRAKVPYLGYVCLKEFGYVPLHNNVRSCTISFKAGKYFIAFLMDVEDDFITTLDTTAPLGVDVGIKEFATISDEREFKNINKTKKIKVLEKKLRHQQRSLSRKYETKKRDKSEKKYYKNIDKNVLKVQKLHVELTNIRQEYVKSVVMSLVRTKPEYIAIEDLNIRGMMKNRCLSKAIQKQNFYYFRLFLEQQCKKRGIELRLINRYYPSSKLCSFCNHKHTELTLRDRIFKCPSCKVEINRDFNAALNIRDCTDYKIYI